MLDERARKAAATPIQVTLVSAVPARELHYERIPLWRGRCVREMES